MFKKPKIASISINYKASSRRVIFRYLIARSTRKKVLNVNLIINLKKLTSLAYKYNLDSKYMIFVSLKCVSRFAVSEVRSIVFFICQTLELGDIDTR